MSLNAELVAALTAIAAFGGRVGKDRVGEGETFPYVTFQPEIDSQVILVGDSEAQAYRMTFQIDTWEQEPDDSVALRTAVIAAVDGLTVRLSGEGALRLRVRAWNRVPEPDAGVIHRAYTVDVVQLV